MSLFDSEKLRLNCPGCGKHVSESVGRLRRLTAIDCPHCKQRIAVDAKDLDKGLRRAEAGLASLEKAFKNFGKR